MFARFAGSAIVALVFAATALASADFTLDDQFGRPHRRSEVFRKGSVVVIAGAQRKTPDAMQAWDQALRGALPDGTRIFGLSNLKKLPFFVPKRSVRRHLAEMLPKTPVLMDWKGKVYPGLGFPDGAVVSVGVFDAAGKRVGLVNGEKNDERLAEVLGMLSR